MSGLIVGKYFISLGEGTRQLGAQLKVADLVHDKSPQSHRDLYSSAAGILAAEKVRMSQREAKLVSLLIGREDMHLRGNQEQTLWKEHTPRLQQLL